MSTNPSSIRQICLRGFLSGLSRQDIAAQIQAAHPTSKAATKSTKHIAWHYGNMRKAGLLATATPAAERQAVTEADVAVVTPEDLIAAEAQRLADLGGCAARPTGGRRRPGGRHRRR